MDLQHLPGLLDWSPSFRFTAITAMALASGLAAGQTYPSKPVRIIVPFAPGGGNDFIGRIVAQKLAESFGQPVVVENRPGAGGVLGAELGVKARPDGYTLNLVGGSYPVNANLYKLIFDPLNDITPIVQISQGPFIVAVHPSTPAPTLKALIALARARPGVVNYASHGTGGIGHLATELLLSMAQVRMLHVPYRGTGPALTETVAGQTSMLFGSVAPTLPMVRAGRLRALAVTTRERIGAAPEIPTVSEAALPGYEVVLWHGLAGPKDLPRPIVDRVNGEVNRNLKLAEVAERLAADGVAAAGGTPDQFMQQIRRDIALWRKVVLLTGVRVD
jgi:tripartite-type tricarboxylate transporter receptor subunit TctC